jgi:RNAse (barnase) inhibitor barstar
VHIAGDSYRSLQYLFRIPACTIGIIVKEVCRALWDVLKDEHMKVIQIEMQQFHDCTFPLTTVFSAFVQVEHNNRKLQHTDTETGRVDLH